MRVLVVEDDPKLSSILRDALENQSYRVVVTQTGTEDLTLGRDFEFEFVILDAMLPGIDGFLGRPRASQERGLYSNHDACIA